MATIEIGNLATRTEATVGPAGGRVLIGETVLEVLHLVADRMQQPQAQAAASGRTSPGAAALQPRASLASS